jgi:hypothetical protein
VKPSLQGVHRLGLRGLWKDDYVDKGCVANELCHNATMAPARDIKEEWANGGEGDALNE